MRTILLILSTIAAVGAIYCIVASHFWPKYYIMSKEDPALFTCLCSACGTIVLYLTLKHMEKSLGYMEKYNKIRARHDERSSIFQEIELLKIAKRELECSSSVATVPDLNKPILHGDEVPKVLLKETKEALKTIQYYADNDRFTFYKEDFLTYKKKLENYHAISAGFRHLSHHIKNSVDLTDEDRLFFRELLSNLLTCADKELLNIIFVNSDFTDAILDFKELFNDESLKRQLRDALCKDPYFKHVKDGAIDCFIQCMKTQKSQEEKSDIMLQNEHKIGKAIYEYLLSEESRLDIKIKNFLKFNKPQNYGHNSFYVLVPDKSQVTYPDSFQDEVSIELDGENLMYRVFVETLDIALPQKGEQETIGIFVTYPPMENA